MLRALVTLAAIGLAVLAVGLWLTRPAGVDEARFAALSGDAARGETVFWAAGCASCHTAPGSEEATLLAGGKQFKTPYGTFVAPNISPHPTAGIGNWSVTELASAVKNGVSRGGSHYYPAFPYTTYGRMTDADVADLWAFMQTLPESGAPSARHELEFPFNIRASVGAWKLLFLSDDWVRPAPTPELERGRYLVEALGHCAECHTPRNRFGALDEARWMEGAPEPAGSGTIPALTPDELTWSAADIAYYLETGFTPDFDSAGGDMAEVVANTARLSAEDRAAIAAYVKALGD